MEKISKTKKFEILELYIIKNVRMFLKVTTLSDITEASGKNLRKDHNKLNEYTCSSQAYDWPKIPQPTNGMILL